MSEGRFRWREGRRICFECRHREPKGMFCVRMVHSLAGGTPDMLRMAPYLLTTVWSCAK